MCSIVIAMVIEAPTRRLSMTTTYSPVPDITTRRRSTRTHDRQFRIRRTEASDIDVVAAMLASESIGVSQESMNWNDNINRLRAQSIIEKQLRYRLAAVEEGRNTAHRMKDYNNNDEICHLWSNTNLRDKIQTASFLSKEESCWTTHNFELTPTCDMMNHVMMTAVSSTGEVVGFCEVAHLPSPPIGYLNDNNDIQQQRIQVSNNSLDIPSSSSSCEETSDSYCDILEDDITEQYDFDQYQQCAQPAIVNLVTSPLHRRKGIASHIISFAKKYISTQWKSSSCNTNNEISLGLYVHPENKSALRLYEKKGFVLVSPRLEPEKEEDNALLYLSQRRLMRSIRRL